MPQELVACRIPEEWSERIDELAKVNGVNKSEILKAAIAAYLGIEPEKTYSPLTLLTERMDQMEKTLTALTQAVEAIHSKASSPQSVKRQIEPNQSISDERSNVLLKPETPATAQSQGSESGIPTACRNCGSTHLRREGKGKLRRDGTRAQRYFCRSCGKSLAY